MSYNVNQELKILFGKSAISVKLCEHLREFCVKDSFKHRVSQRKSFSC